MQAATLTGLRMPLTPLRILIWLLLVVRIPTNFVKYCRAGSQTVTSKETSSEGGEKRSTAFQQGKAVQRSVVDCRAHRQKLSVCVLA